jgi:hypothetical protein
MSLYGNVASWADAGAIKLAECLLDLKVNFLYGCKLVNSWPSGV